MVWVLMVVADGGDATLTGGDGVMRKTIRERPVVDVVVFHYPLQS